MRKLAGMVVLSVGVIVFTHVVVHSQVAGQGGFTATIEETRFDAQSGAFADRNVETWAVRADGSIAQVREVALPDGTLALKKSVYEAQNHRRIAIDDASESIVTFYHQRSPDGSSGPLADGSKSFAEECGPGEGRTMREILGFETYQFDHCPSGSCEMRVTEWRAPRLRCMPLSLRAEMRQEDGIWLVTNERVATSVVQGPPDESFFAIPEGYVERAPSEVLAERGRRFPSLAPSERDLERAREIPDVRYRSSQKRP